MSPVLHLEYACTNAEQDQARTLALRKQVGGGSKWRTRVVLLLVLVGTLLALWFETRAIPVGYRALIIAAIVVGSCVFTYCKRKLRRSAPGSTKLDISEKGLAILGPAARVAMPWSAFSQCLESSDLFVLLDQPKEMLVVIPKRTFPSEEWQIWFREQASNAPSLPAPPWNEPAVLTPSTSADRITFTIRYGFWDSFDQTIASWFTWGACLFVAGLFIAIPLHSAANAPAQANNSDPLVFSIFMFAVFLVFITTIILVFSVRGWLSHARYSGSQEITLSEESIDFAGPAGSGTVPWTRFKHYKETFWSFIIWRGSVWMMFPKRAFESWDDVSSCRELLGRHLQKSRWFFG